MTLTIKEIDRRLGRIDELYIKYDNMRWELTKPGFKMQDKQPKIKRLNQKK